MQCLIARDLSEVVVESLEGISNEGQAHLGTLLHDTYGLGSLHLLRLKQSRVVGLIDLVRREVCRIDVAREAWLEGSPDASERVEFDATEEGVALDLMSAAATQTVLGVTDQAVEWSAFLSLHLRGRGPFKFIPSYQILRLRAQRDIIGEVQALSPVDNLAVRIMAVLGAERWPAHQTFEHNGSQTPPIAVKAVAVAGEDFGGDIIRRSHRGVSH